MLRCRVLLSSVSRHFQEYTPSEINYEALFAYKKVKGHLLIPKTFVAGSDGDPNWPPKFINNKIGEMAEAIRRKMRRNKLPSADVAKLKDLGFVDNITRDRMESLRTAFQIYVERFGSGRVPKSFSIDASDASWPAKVRGINLGHVLAKIRAGHYPQLVPELRAMGVVVNHVNATPDFERNFNALKVYKQLNDTVKVRHHFVIPKDDTRYPVEARGIKLGLWMRNLRKRGYFAEHRQTLLDFGVTLEYKAHSKTGFEYNYTALVVYKSIHGSVDVPEDFIVPFDDERYPETSRGTNLGAFISRVQNGGYISSRQRLIDLGVKMKAQVQKDVQIKEESDVVSNLA